MIKNLKIGAGLLLLTASIYSHSSHAQTVIPAVLQDAFIQSNTGGMGPLDANDYFGVSLAHIGDLNGDGIEDMAVGAHADDDGGTDRGAVYICFMNTDGTIASYQKISDTQGGFTGVLNNADNFGVSVAGIGDLDRDGAQDIAVAAFRDDDGGTNRGALYILFMNTDGTVKSHQKISSTEGDFTGAIGNADYFANDVGNAGDVNGDGIIDLVVTHYQDDDGGTNRGAIWVLFMGRDGKVDGQQKISDTQGGFTATLDNGDYFGIAADGIDDLDADGVPDLIVGAFYDDDGGTNTGASYILFLNSDGTVKSHSKITGEFNGKEKVWSIDTRASLEVAWAGDVNRDGIPDVLIGAYYAFQNHRGAYYILCMNRDGSVQSYRRISEGYGWDNTALGSSAFFGRSLTYMGDLNDDGYEDYAAGLNWSGGRGAVYVHFMDSTAVYANQPGVVYDWTKVSDLYGGFTGSLDADDEFGYSMASIGDFTGNGVEDLVVGAYSDDDGGTNRGAVYLCFMNSDMEVDSFQKISDTQGGFTGTLDNNDNFGISVASLGDVNNDGVVDIAVGASLDDDGGTNRGAIWQLFLKSDGTVSSYQKISSTEGSFDGALDNEDYLGVSVSAVGDINGDGNIDLAVGAHGDDDGGTNRGAVYICFMSSSNTVLSTQKLSDTQGGVTRALTNSGLFGMSVTNMGDLNADGTLDLAVGGPGLSSYGGLFTFLMNSDGTVASENYIYHNNLGYGLGVSDNFARNLTAVEDLNGDGHTDLVATAYNAQLTEYRTGEAWVIFLDGSGGMVDYQHLSQLQGNFQPCLEANDQFGISVTTLGDMNGDGHPEVIFGTSEDDDGGTNKGGYYVFSLYNSLALVDENTYVPLRRKLDGGFYTAHQGQLYFRYEEEYNSTALQYKVYDKHGIQVLTEADQPINIAYGENFCHLDLSCNGNGLTNGHYILEVINEKGEKWYLRFHNFVICNGGGLSPFSP